MFAENDHIKYRDLCGIVNFVCDQYIVMKVPSVKGLNPALLLIYRENYKNIISLKDSDK